MPFDYEEDPDLGQDEAFTEERPHLNTDEISLRTDIPP